MSVRSGAEDRPRPGQCPGEAELRRFDRGKLSVPEIERLSNHVVACRQCAWVLREQYEQDTRLLAELLTPGRTLLKEPEFDQARAALLARPEPISAHDLESAELSLLLGSWLNHGEVPRQVGPYALRYELGRGAMGVVYRARHANLKRDAALKILHPHLVADPAILDRFYCEMEAIGQLRDPHIVQAYDAGQSGHVHFLAMEYVDGADAARLCAHLGRLATSDACEIVRQAALGLETASRHNMVHRDIKPSNLMVARDGRVMILDLGLASFRSEGSDFSDCDAVGTVDYMAPEQWRRSPRIDIRADLYSLGCTLFKLLDGRPPFFDAPDDGVSKMQAHLYQDVPSLREDGRDVPRDLQLLVNRMMAKVPEDRVGSPREVTEALLPWCKGSDLAARVQQCVEAPSEPSSWRARSGDKSPAIPRTAVAGRTSRRRMVYALAAAALLLCLVLAAVVVRVTDKGAVVVTVDQPGAKVEIDSIVKSTKNADEPIIVRVPSGQYEIRITKEGFRPSVETIQVQRGDKDAVTVTLQPSDPPQPAATAEADQLALMGHEGSVTAVDISGDGKWILTGGTDNTVRLWNAETREQKHCLRGHQQRITAVAFRPDGRSAVSGSKDGTARLWNLETAEEAGRFSGHTDEVMCIALSKDGNRLLTSSMDRTVRMWDVQTGQPLAILSGHRSWVRGVAFLPDERRAVSCGNDAVAILWDLETGRMQKVLQGHTHVLSSVSISHDGRFAVTGSWDKTVRLWNLRTEQQINVLERHRAPVRHVTFLADNNHVLSASEDHELRLWNPFSGESQVFSGHTGRVVDVAANPSAGLFVSASDDGTARIWELPPLEANPGPDDLVSRPLEPLIGESARAVQPRRKWQASRQGLQSISVSANGQLVATGGDDGVVRLWESNTGNLNRQLRFSSEAILSVEFSPSGEWIAVAGKDGQVRLWKLAGDDAPRVLDGHQGWVTGLAFAPDGTWLMSGGFDTTARIWDVEQAAVVKRFDDPMQWIRCVAIAPSEGASTAVSAGNAGYVQLWNTGSVMSPGPRLGQPHHWYMIACCAISPDGRLLAAAGWSRTVRFWEVQSGRLLAELPGHHGTIYDLAWCSESTVLTASADRTLRLWDIRRGRELVRYIGHDDAIRGVSVSAGADVIASTGEDGNVCVWPAAGEVPSESGDG